LRLNSRRRRPSHYPCYAGEGRQDGAQSGESAQRLKLRHAHLSNRSVSSGTAKWQRHARHSTADAAALGPGPGSIGRHAVVAIATAASTG
jgi:hypothetical protein